MEVIYFVVIIILMLVGMYYGVRDLMMPQVIKDFATYKTLDNEFDIDKMWEALNLFPQYEPKITVIPTSLLKTEYGPKLCEIANSMSDVHFSEHATEIFQFPKPKFNLWVGKESQ